MKTGSAFGSRIVDIDRELEALTTRREPQRVELDGRRAAAAEADAGRDQAAVDSALAAMLAAARSGENMIPPMLAAARAEATLGEICDALRQEWGVYSEAPAF